MILFFKKFISRVYICSKLLILIDAENGRALYFQQAPFTLKVLIAISDLDFRPKTKHKEKSIIIGLKARFRKNNEESSTCLARGRVEKDDYGQDNLDIW